MTARRRLGLLDQIRGMAILLVVLTHLPFWDAGTRLGLGFPFWVDQAVPLFMVTSGFVLLRDTPGGGGALRRLVRLLVPYAISFVAMMAVLKARDGASVETSVAAVLGLSLGEAESLGKPLGALALFVCGGPGPGGYYIPVLVELYLLVPLLRKALSAGPRGLAVAVLAVLLWGFAAQFGVVSPQVYRLVVIRYVPYILIGGWLQRRLAASALTASRTSLAVLSLSGVVGAAYLLSVNYLGMPPLATVGLAVDLVAGGLLAVAVGVGGRPVAPERRERDVPRRARRLSLPRREGHPSHLPCPDGLLPVARCRAGVTVGAADARVRGRLRLLRDPVVRLCGGHPQ